MAQEPIVWPMNGTEYAGKLGSQQIIGLEKELGVGILHAEEKMGVEFTHKTLLYAARKMNKELNGAKFVDDFDAEMEEVGIEAMMITATKLLKASGALGKEKAEKKG